MVSRIFTTSLFFLTLWSQVAAALEVSATIDKNPVMLDESIVLTVTASGDVDRSAFDSTPLLADFVVGRTSTSSEKRMVNFSSMTNTTIWRTTLFPQKEGVYTIPSLNIDGEYTDPIEVSVIKPADLSTSDQRDFFITAELESNSVYVQQHVNYVVKIHLARNMERGSLQAPVLNDGSVEQIGEDKQYNDIINGKRFQIIERTYVIVPEKSGEFVLQAPILSGEVLAPNSRASFGFFNRTQTISRRGPQLTLNVKPIPDSFTGDWLPSEFVELNEEWSDDNFVVGEPITRTLTLTVAGQKKEQLPELKQIYPPYVKSYPDQPVTASATKDLVVIAQRQESTAIIPSQEGTLVIPGVELAWFNVNTGRTETASIPARSFTVNAAENTTLAAPQSVVSTTSEQERPKDVEMSESTFEAHPVWMGLSGGLAIAWIMTLIAWWRAKKAPQSHPQNPVKAPSTKAAGDLSALTHALKSGNMKAIQLHLYAWLNTLGNKRFSSLSEALNDSSNCDIKHAFNTVMSNQYGKTKTSVDYSHLLRAIKQRSSVKETASEKSLEPLYKA